MKNYTQIKIFILVVCLLAIGIAFSVQLNGQNFLQEGCSYLDPITIDLLAFAFAIFLVIEGLYRINEHKLMGLKKQFTRIARVVIGCAIITVHVLQFFYK